ncbi:MAG: DivIVA domain-containing protein, partial [Staphylococcus sp.]|nr:DivIVA domain-containing protein [Staphylococcus sp.]
AIEKARHLSFQTEDMKRQSKIFRSRFRMLVEAQLDLLKNDDWDYLLNYDFDAEQVTQENIQHLNPQDVNPNANSETPTSETTETLSNEENQSINSNETTNTNKSTSENKDVSSSESSSNK